MTQFVVIDPAAHLIRMVECEDYKQALAEAGLQSMSVDHGMIDYHTGIVVADDSLFKPPEQQSYFELNHRLYGGPALLYGTDTVGQTIDVENANGFRPTFYHGRREVEEAIEQDKVECPEIRVNGGLVWRWPEPTPYKGGDPHD